MDEDLVAGSFLRCRFCGVLFSPNPPPDSPRHDDAPLGCAAPLIPPGHCFGCRGNAADDFSGTQLHRSLDGEPAWCKSCLSSGRRGKLCEAPLPQPSLDARLTDAVQEADVAAVAELLNAGADPNYTRQAVLPGALARGIPWPARGLWRADGSEIPEADPANAQPTTPLKLVVFRISDCMLDEADLARFLEVAKLLIAAGADPRPAAAHARGRYGFPEPGAQPEPGLDVGAEEGEGRRGAFVAIIDAIGAAEAALAGRPRP